MISDFVVTFATFLHLSLSDNLSTLFFIILIEVVHYYNMNKLSAKQLKLASESTLILPKTTPIKVNLKKRQTVVSTPRSLSNSKLSIKSETSSHYIKLPNSFYNDHKNIYQTRSRILSEKTVSYQSKNLSVSQRHRY